jgi:SulP family sulfate permease
MPTLAGILMVVAYNMSEWRTFRGTLTAPRGDVAVLLTTFFLTVFVDLTVALGVGMVLASFMFIRQMADATTVRSVTDMMQDDDADAAMRRLDVPPGVVIYEIDGPFFFGAAETFKETIAALARPPKVLVLRMRKVGLLDATGIALLRDLSRKGGAGGFTLVLSEVQSQPMKAIKDSKLLDLIGIDNCVPDIELAMVRVQALITESRPSPRS